MQSIASQNFARQLEARHYLKFTIQQPTDYRKIKFFLAFCGIKVEAVYNRFNSLFGGSNS